MRSWPWLLRGFVCLAVCAGSSGCLRSTEFHCTTDGDCTGGGTCEGTGFCSFTDAECASGQRYGEFSGTYSNQCVGDATGGDGGVDARSDGSGGPCPDGYAAITGGGSHLYKRLTSAQWMPQRTACEADGANVYLAIPDDMAEAVAIAELGANAVTWVGIHDQATEATFQTVQGGTPPYLQWNANEPNNQGDQDCVAVIMTSGLLQTDRCTDTRPAVCECEP